MKYTILIILSAIALLFSCKDPYENSTYLAYDEYPAATYLDKHSDQFSMWVEILHYADLYNAVNQASETYTLFVPDNDAVTAFYADRGISSITELGKQYAINLVQFHIINDEISQSEFTEGGKLKSPTVSGDYLTVSYNETSTGEGGLNAIYLNGEARVKKLAEPVTNGLIYVLESVLAPLVETIYDRLTENDNYSIFRRAIEYTGWQDRLSTPYDTIYSLTGTMTVLKKNFTLLAVADNIFAQEGITSVESLAGKLGAGNDYTNDENALRKYVGYHLVSSTYYEADLFTFPIEDGVADTVALWTTQALNAVFSTNNVDGKYYLNYRYDEETGTSLVAGATDKVAKNGIIHELDGWFPLSYPDPVTVLWDLCDYADVEALVNTYGGANSLGDCYQIWQTAEHQLDITGSEITSYTFKAYSSTSTGSWKQLGYLLTKSSNNTTNTYGAYKNDMLVVNLGYMGHVSMTSPAILPGKYRVELYYGYGTSMTAFREGGSKCQVSIDNNHTSEVYIYDGIPNTLGLYYVTAFTEIEFDTISAHTLKIVLMDSRASTSNIYRLQLDHVKFIPIN